MGPDLEKSKAGNGVLVGKDNESVSQVLEDKLVKCVSSYEDNNFHLEALNNDDLDKPSEDVEINIIECSNPVDDAQLEARYEDVTESMSSFGDTLSETENYPVLGDEAESHLAVGDAAASVFDGYGGAFLLRKKKLTDHWRRFIRPLMWRCKWIELQLKEFQSQALKYDRELAEHAQRKHFDFDSFVIEGFDTKSLPFSSCAQRKKVMKRKKRKRIEETTDIKSYMLQHNLFSYYENMKSAANGAMNDDFRNNPDKAISANDEFGLQEEWASLETKGEDNVRENILLKIDALQLQVRKLKARMEKVVSENPGKFASVDRLISPAACDALTNSDKNKAYPRENEDRMPVRPIINASHHLLESAVSSDVEVTPQHHLGLMCDNTKEGILIHNEAVKEEMQDEENFGNQHHLQTDEETTVQVPEGANVSRSNFGGKTLPKSRSNPPSSKRTGRRKSSRGGWNCKF